MKCEHCGIEVTYVQLPNGGNICCGENPIPYGNPTQEPICEFITPDGNRCYGSILSNKRNAVGIGFKPHTCIARKPVQKSKYIMFESYDDLHEQKPMLASDGELQYFDSPSEGMKCIFGKQYRHHRMLRSQKSIGICSVCGHPLFLSQKKGFRYYCFNCKENTND